MNFLRGDWPSRGSLIVANEQRHWLLAVMLLALVAFLNQAFSQVVDQQDQQSVVELETQPQAEVIDRQSDPVQLGTSAEGTDAETKPMSVDVETSAEVLSSKQIEREDEAAPLPLDDVENPQERFYSAGRRAEPRLWALLNSGLYQDLEQEISQLEQLDQNWQPPPELLYWLHHHLAEEAEVAKEDEAVPSKKKTRRRASAARDPYSDAAIRAVRLQKLGKPDAALETLEPWLPRIEARRDAERMALLGWLRLNTDHTQASLQAFELSYQWHASADAAKGELLARAKLDDVEQLIEQSNALVERWPTLESTAAASLRSMAMRLYQEGQYQQAQVLLDSALKIAPAERDNALLTAWNLLQLGDAASAAETFGQLYREKSDGVSAEGLLNSLRQLGADDELERLARKPGPLRQLWLGDQVDRLFARGDFIRAYRTDPSALPALANVDSPAFDLGLFWRERSGDPGLGRLTETRVPVAHISQWIGLVQIEVAIDRVALDAGRVRSDAIIGSAANMLKTEPRSMLGSSSKVDNGLEWNFGLGYQGDWRLAAQVGQTSTDGALAAKMHGSISVGQLGARYAWNATLAHRPVRESLLSYAGLVDPWNGEAWGQVFRSGLSLEGWYQLNPAWTLAGLLRANDYQGTEVASNTGYGAALSIGRNLRHPLFSYLTVGPAVEYKHFQRNLNHFTVGHGGYYSPELDLGLMLAMDFRTREAGPWLIQGSARAGWRLQDQAQSPWFPLNSSPLRTDSLSYEGSTDSGPTASLRLHGVAQLSPQWQVGMDLYGNYSQSFQEYSGQLFIRWLFKPRRGVFSSDLAGGAASYLPD